MIDGDTALFATFAFHYDPEVKSRATLLWMLLALAAEVRSAGARRTSPTSRFAREGHLDVPRPATTTARQSTTTEERIVELLPGGKMRVTPRNPTDLTPPGIRSTPAGFSFANFQFPLRVGAAWSYASPRAP